MERRGGWVISKTNLSTGWCSLSRITTTTFSTSFCKDKDRKIPSLKQAVSAPAVLHVLLTQWEYAYLLWLTALAVIQSLSTVRLLLRIRKKKAFAKPFLDRCYTDSLLLRPTEMKCTKEYICRDPILEQKRKCTAILLHHLGMDNDQEVKICLDWPNIAALYYCNVKLITFHSLNVH